MVCVLSVPEWMRLASFLLEAARQPRGTETEATRRRWRRTR